MTYAVTPERTPTDEAAGTLAAGLWQRFTRVTIPLIYPGFIAASLIAFITSFDELTIALFITGVITATLPRQLWSKLLMTAHSDDCSHRYQSKAATSSDRSQGIPMIPAG